MEVLRYIRHHSHSSQFNTNREMELAENERHLRLRISELENAVKVDVNSRNEILEKLGLEIGE